MSDYGIKTAQKGKSALSKDQLDIVMNTRYPFAKIDQTNLESFRTTTISFINDVVGDTDVMFYKFRHGYTYKPQVWGLWDIEWSASLGGFSANGYGQLSNSTGFPSSSIWYTFDEEWVYLNIYKGDLGFGFSAIGTIVTLTTYIFADDLTSQDYTIDT